MPAREPDHDPPARRSQAARRERAEGRLLAAAMHLVGQRGTQGMTLAEVGRTAGLSGSLAAHYFGSKAGMVERLLGSIHTQFTRAVDQAPARQPGLASVLAMIEVYFIRPDPNWTNTRALFVLMAEALSPDSPLRAEVAGYNRMARAFLTEHIAIGIARGEVRPEADPALAAELILAGMRGTLNQWLIEPALIDLRAARDAMTRMVRDMLAIERHDGAAARPTPTHPSRNP